MAKLIDVRPPVEQALLVGAPRKGSADAQAVDEHLVELGATLVIFDEELSPRQGKHLAVEDHVARLGLEAEWWRVRGV